MKPLKEALISKNKRNWASTAIKYNITKKDMIGELTGFPLGVVVRMLEETEWQGNKPDISAFQRVVTANSQEGGFDWDASAKGNEFWYNVLMNLDFDRFFKVYPDYKKYNV